MGGQVKRCGDIDAGQITHAGCDHQRHGFGLNRSKLDCKQEALCRHIEGRLDVERSTAQTDIHCLFESLHHIVQGHKRCDVVDLGILPGSQKAQAIQGGKAGPRRRSQLLAVDAHLWHILGCPAALELNGIDIAILADRYVTAGDSCIPFLEHGDQGGLNVCCTGAVADIAGLEQQGIQGDTQYE